MIDCKKKLLIEGWRGFTHSYAMVSQWYALTLAQRDDVELFFKEVDYYTPNWTPRKGLFNADHEQTLSRLTATDPAACDVVLRVSAPHNFTEFRGRKTVVFSTSEYKTLAPSDLHTHESFLASVGRPEVAILTPSHWSAEGFYRLGFPSEQVIVAPLGVDVATLHPAPATRELMRERLGLKDFVFMNVGAMTPNKGMALLLKAFITVVKKYPGTRLVLKGADTIYNSSKILESYLSELSAADLQLLQKHCIYHGGVISTPDMAALFQVADAYVSPYLAEGFNIPVLEAAACGIPVICTAGGSTEDFVSDEFARKINSKISSCSTKGGTGEILSPDLDHLTELMLAMVEDDAWRKRASLAAAEHVRTKFTWEIVTEQLLAQLF